MMPVPVLGTDIWSVLATPRLSKFLADLHVGNVQHYSKEKRQTKAMLNTVCYLMSESL